MQEKQIVSTGGISPEREGKQQQIYPDPNCPGISFPIYHYSSQWRVQYFTGGDLVSVFGNFVSGVVAFAFIVAACACISVGVGILVTNTAVGLLVMGIGCLLFASEFCSAF